jgi:2-keto-4-pentenoate hydratase/2-oxohepta-3-ene-1,7-dioic acid hydratase in catechol pathway
MKIVRYRYRNEECYGVLKDEAVFSLSALARLFGATLPPKLEKFIEQSDWTLKVAEELLQKTQNRNVESVSLLLKDVTVLAPIAHPPKIICLGRNYVDHSAEMKAPVPDEPVIFMKPHTTIIGPNDKIIKPSMVKELDYEGELAVIIGKKAKNVSVLDAESVIFGYTVFNDVSARDYQFKDGQWTRGKSFDTFAPTGPCVVTTAQLPDTDNLRLRTWVNSELRQNATTRSMGLNVSQIVHHLSRVMTLEPFEIIATGTPSGVGFAMKPPKFLKHDDVVRIEIGGIGVLENTVEEVD